MEYEVIAFCDGEPIKEMPSTEDIYVAIPLVEENINVEKLTKQRRGYFAVHSKLDCETVSL